jgi:hypothetical protein
MQRFAILISILLIFPIGTFASKLERGLQSRWLGAWVVTTVETYSDCAGIYTPNRVNGHLVSSRGGHRFARGELAKVVRVDVKRRRVDLFLSVAEPLLMPHEDGPFTLYNEASCRMELEVEVPRQMVKAKDLSNIDQMLAPILERYSTLERAQRARSWNRRERQDYPEDYERTLAEHAIWKAERRNALIQSRIDEALGVTAEITDRVGSDPPYLSGFSKGVEAARGLDVGECSRLLSLDLSVPRSNVSHARNEESGMPPRVARGYEDGKRLILGLEMIRGLPECFVPVPNFD